MGAGTDVTDMGGAFSKLFGDNQTFISTIEMNLSSNQDMVMLGKMTFDHGKTRVDTDMTQMKVFPPQTIEKMRNMGMDKTTVISLPEKKITYMIYPGLQAYAQASNGNPNITNDYKVSSTTDLGNETVDGHACVKAKIVITDQDGNLFKATVWKASDLKDFPIKIEQVGTKGFTTMLFKDVTFATPIASDFEPPKDFTKCDDKQTMREVIMKRMGTGAPK